MKIPVLLAAALILLSISPDVEAGSLTSNTMWTGRVRVVGTVVVEEGVTLTIQPGTLVEFVPAKTDETGLAGSGLLVKGSIIARGELGGEVIFTSASGNPRPGDWGEIKIVESQGKNVFKYCSFRYGGWGLHVHDSKIRVENCTFRNNKFGGIRGQGDGLEIFVCLLEGMDIGIRYWKGAPVIRGCTITRNITGIFFRQGCEDAVVKNNNIHSNTEYDVKLGDGQTSDIDLSENWWGTTDVPGIKMKVYDKDREGYIGSAIVEPLLSEEVIVE